MSNLTNIFLPVQRIIPFSNVEGIGNRTSIFLQGCNINCLYCHNPETIAFRSSTAKPYSLAALVEEVKASMPFIRGITVSGGEPTVHARELTIFFREVHKLGLTCYLDSNGFFPYEAISQLIAETDKFLFDIKGIGPGLEEVCFSGKYLKEKPQTEKQEQSGSVSDLSEREEAAILAGACSEEILSRNIRNLEKLLVLDKVEEVRLVYIKGFYEERETVRQIAERLKDYPHVLFKLIRVHAKGARGAKEIARHMPNAKETEALANYAKELGLQKQVVIL